MFNMLREPALYVFTGGLPPKNIARLARRYEAWERRRSPDGSELWFNWVLRLRQRTELVGYVQATVAHDDDFASGHADIAWVVGSSWQHRSYATEAAQVMVEWLGVCEIRASINPAHAASIRVAENVGLGRTEERSGNELLWKLVRSSRL